MSILSHLAKGFLLSIWLWFLNGSRVPRLNGERFLWLYLLGGGRLFHQEEREQQSKETSLGVSPDLNCWGWMIEQRKSGNIWAVAIMPRLGVLFYGIQARKASSLNNWSEKESWLNLWWIQEDLLSLQQKSHLSALALALFCYPPYCKVGFFVPFWDYFGTFG